ncbi:hypothetical protein [Curvivirga sp.]|uniref:hypothetical protein n=1 Tax=Curvivirga sp. TaxID=2856848 RepID=UPI003B596CAA
MKQDRIIRDGVEGRKNLSQLVSVTEHQVIPDIRFNSKKVQNLYNWWYSHQSDIPRKSSFDIVDHLKDAEGYFLYSILADDDFYVRVLGEKAIDLLGNRYTNVRINTEAAKVDAHLDALITYLQKILSAKTAFWCEGEFIDQSGHKRRFQSIDCPLWDDANNISHIVGVMEAI